MTDNENDDDDDLAYIRRKIPKLDDTISPAESETCSICFQAWTTSGDHKIVSIECGHVYGQKCIELWLRQQPNCPMCKRKFSKKSIRPLFLNVKAITMEDNSEFVKTVDELAKTKEDLLKAKCDYSYLQLKNQLAEDKVKKLEEQLLELNEVSKNSKQIGNNNENIFFKLKHKIQISAIGDCRVMDYSHLDNNICVSCPSSVKVVTGYGVRVVDLNQMKSKKFINLHSKMIRNVEFSRFYSTKLMLSCSFDRYVKLTSTHNNSVVASFACEFPVWSCTWSNNNNIVYAGLCNGIVSEIDIRNTSSAVSRIFSQQNGPIVSLRYICSNEYVKHSGLLVSNSTGVVFLHKSPGAFELDSSLADSKTDILFQSLNYQSTLTNTAVNSKTCHMLSTFRPSDKSKFVRYLVSEIEPIADSSDGFYSSEKKSLYGGTAAQYISRSCFLTDDTINYAVAANESNCSVKVWDLSNYDSQEMYPPEVTPKKPVIDLCQYGSNPAAFAALNCDNLYFYRLQE